MNQLDPHHQDAATESLLGHCAMESVTGYIVQWINGVCGTSFEDTLELVSYLQKEGNDVYECPECGWYADFIDSCCYCDTEACDDCMTYHECEEQD